MKCFKQETPLSKVFVVVDDEYLKAALKFLEHKTTAYVSLIAILGSQE